MDFFEVVKARRSIRAFTDRMVEADKVQQILEAANQSPSAGNLQAYEIFLVTQNLQKRELARAALEQDFIVSAPFVLVFAAHPARSESKYKDRGVRLYSVQDATIACCFAMLAVTALELATVWVGAFSDDAVRKVLGAPEGILPVAMLPIGYPAEKPASTPRRNLDELVHELRD
jgi:nitroreductase